MARYFFRITVRNRGSAWPHAVYLQRLGFCGSSRGGREEVEEYGFGNMPAWAGERCLDFWKASDDYERLNGTAYHEYLFAIPRELSAEGRRRLAAAVVEGEMSRFPYMYVIHRKTASDGLPQPHCHLMFSSRMLDGIERPKKQFFRRFNRLHPERGGCQKDTMKKTRKKQREACLDLRKRIEVYINRELEREGLSCRVTCKSLKDQGVTRPPEPQVGLPSWNEGKKGIVARREDARRYDEAEAGRKRQVEKARRIRTKLDADAKERIAEQEVRCWQEIAQNSVQAALESEEQAVELKEWRLFSKLRSGDVQCMPDWPGRESSVFSPLTLEIPPRKPLEIISSRYRKRCAAAIAAQVKELEKEAKQVFFSLVLTYADCSRWGRWARSVERELSGQTGENYDRRTIAERRSDLEQRKELLQAAKRMEKAAMPGALARAIKEARIGEAQLEARAYIRWLRSASDIAREVLSRASAGEITETSRAEFLTQKLRLLRMETGEEPGDGLFEELSRKLGSRRLARYAYSREESRRREEECFRERDRPRERTRDLCR